MLDKESADIAEITWPVEPWLPLTLTRFARQEYEMRVTGAALAISFLLSQRRTMDRLGTRFKADPG